MKRLLMVCVCLALLVCGCAEQKGEESPAPPAAVESPAAQEAGEAQPPEEAVPREEEPPRDLPFDSPENHGVDTALLAALHTAVAAADEPNIWAMVIARNGAVIDEYYGVDKRNGKQFDETTPFYLASCTKSVTGALVGIAIHEGLVSGVDAKLSEYFPALAGGDDAKGEITLEHLLTHTSGIAWDEWNGGGLFHALEQAENRVDFVLAQPMAAEPGTTFNYNSGGSHLLSAVLEKATGQSTVDFARERLFGPLGMESVNWPADPQGITDGGSGIEMTMRDAVKFGQLYLDGGSWQGRQVIPREWVEQSTTAQSAGTGGRTGAYGYQWWIRPFGEESYAAFFALGAGGHHILVVPELELVVAISCLNSGDSYAPWPFITDYILPACN